MYRKATPALIAKALPAAKTKMVRSSLQLAAVLAVLISAPACDLGDDKKKGAQEGSAENTREAKEREVPSVWPGAGPSSYRVSLVTSLRSGAAPVPRR